MPLVKFSAWLLMALATWGSACTCTGQVGPGGTDAGAPGDAGDPIIDAGPQVPTCGLTVLTQPSAPTLTASNVTSYEVTLTWQGPAEATQYRVMRGAAQVALVTAPTFTHRPAVPGEIWTYRVTALKDDGAESAPSNEVSVTIPAETAGPLQSLQPGHWYEIPNSHLRGSKAALTSADYAWLGQGEGLSGIMNDWSSGAFDTQRDRLYVSGGGHNGYFGNEVYGFDLRTLAWVRLTEPNPVTGECPAPELGVNCATHTYDGLEYLPLPFDRFMAVGWDGWTQNTLNLDTNRWSAYPDKPQKGSRTGANCAYDVATRSLWYHAGGGALSAWDPTTGLWSLRGGVDNAGYYRTGLIDPKRKRYIGLGNGGTETWSIDALGKFVPMYVHLATTGDTDIEAAGNPGAEYDPVTDQLVAWKGGGDIYTLDLTTNVWTKRAAVGAVTAGPPNGTGTYGRFRYVPSMNLFVEVSGVDENVFVYRLDSTPPKNPKRLEVASAKSRLEANLSTTLSAKVVSRDDTATDVTTGTVFSSLDPAIATVDAAGTVHALTPGHARLQASYTDSMTRIGVVGGLELEVVGLSGALVLDSLSIEPAQTQLAVVGAARPLTVAGRYHRDGDVFTRDVSCLVTLTSDLPVIASISGVTLSAVAAGSTTVHATLGAVTTSASLTVVGDARSTLKTLNFQPPGPARVTGWAVADDSGFDAARGWGWLTVPDAATREDRDGKNDPRLASFVQTSNGTFRLQVPDGRYHLAASMGDNAFGGGLASLDVKTVSIVAHIGTGNTAGQAIVDVTGGTGLVLTVVGPINWLAVMPVNGLSFDSVLASAKTW